MNCNKQSDRLNELIFFLYITSMFNTANVARHLHDPEPAPFINFTTEDFQCAELLNPTPNPKFVTSVLVALRDCLFSKSAAFLRIGRVLRPQPKDGLWQCNNELVIGMGATGSSEGLARAPC
jgi:hypothetical protein